MDNMKAKHFIEEIMGELFFEPVEDTENCCKSCDYRYHDRPYDVGIDVQVLDKSIIFIVDFTHDKFIIDDYTVMSNEDRDLLIDDINDNLQYAFSY